MHSMSLFFIAVDRGFMFLAGGQAAQARQHRRDEPMMVMTTSISIRVNAFPRSFSQFVFLVS